MVLALVAYAVVAGAIVIARGEDRLLLILGLSMGAPAVMLLGAGLANAARGSRVDAVAVGVAFAVGMPVASVASLVIGGWILDGFAAGSSDIAGSMVRRSVSEALAAAPILAATSAGWVSAVRRWSVAAAHDDGSAGAPGSAQ
jgi:hypothetical protein